MNPLLVKLLFVASIATAGFLAGWQWNGSRWEAKYTARENQLLAAQNEAQEKFRATEQAWQKQKDEALNDAKKRETILRRDAANAAAAADGLRDELARARSGLPQASADAARKYAEALSDVLGSCTKRYSELAAEADRIESERQTLIDTWPR